MTVPVRVGANGTITKNLKKNLEVIPTEYSIDSLQNTALLSTSHITMKVQKSETSSPTGVDYPLSKGQVLDDFFFSPA
jgi:hypothetical protein